MTEEFGKGFSETNIRNFRKFYIEFQHLAIQQALSAESIIQIQQTVSAKLSWSHYERLMRVENLLTRHKELLTIHPNNPERNTQVHDQSHTLEQLQEQSRREVQETDFSGRQSHGNAR